MRKGTNWVVTDAVVAALVTAGGQRSPDLVEQLVRIGFSGITASSTSASSSRHGKRPNSVSLTTRPTGRAVRPRLIGCGQERESLAALPRPPRG